MTWIKLSHRGILTITGPDRTAFLQGLITQDIGKLTQETPLYTALLSPQGKYLHDLFLTEKGECLYLEGERERLPDLLKRLTLFKLRAKITLNLEPSLSVLIALEDAPLEKALITFRDPRPIGPWTRSVILDKDLPAQMGDFDVYNQRRLELGLPEGSWDMVPEKGIPLECGLDDLGAFDWTKGCYMGQELTARTKHRGLVRKRLLPFKAPFPLEESHTTLMQGETGDIKAGGVTSFAGYWGLARLRLEALNTQAPLLLDHKPVEVSIPSWMKLPQEGKPSL